MNENQDVATSKQDVATSNNGTTSEEMMDIVLRVELLESQLLSVLQNTLKALCLLDAHPAKRLIVNLHRLFSLTFWWPTLSHDGKVAWQFVNGTNMDQYHRSRQVLPANFIKSVQKYNVAYPTLSIHVDKTNTHRLF